MSRRRQDDLPRTRAPDSRQAGSLAAGWPSRSGARSGLCGPTPAPSVPASLARPDVRTAVGVRRCATRRRAAHPARLIRRITSASPGPSWATSNRSTTAPWSSTLQAACGFQDQSAPPTRLSRVEGRCLAFVLLPPPLHQWGQNPRVGACSRSLTDRRSRRSALLPVGTPQAVGLALLRPALEELVQHGDAPTAPGSHDRLSTNLPQDQGQAASEGGKTDVVPRHRRPPATQCVCGCRRGDPWARYLRWRYLGAC
jgi:hypothetical protein